MEKLISLICLVVCCQLISVTEASVNHAYFTAGWNSGGPAIRDADGKLLWQNESKDEMTDGWVLPDGGVVFSFSRRKEGIAGVIRLDSNKDKLWEYRVPAGHDNHSCQPLPHGGFLLGECGVDALWMVEIDAEGREVKRVKVAGAPKDLYHALRAVRKTRDGTYLGTLMKGAGDLEGNHAYEWDASGKLLGTFPSGFFHAVRLENGNTLVSEGHGRKDNQALLTEYAPDFSIVWELLPADLEAAGIGVYMVCGFHRLPNGNTVVSNVRHGKNPLGKPDGAFPKLFEITRYKRLVWSVPESVYSLNMGSVQVLGTGNQPWDLER